MRVDWQCGGLIGCDILVVVEQEASLVKLVAVGQDCVGNLGSIIEGGRQTANLTANHHNLLGEEPLEEGSGFVSNTEDPDIVKTLTSCQLLLQLGPDGLVHVAVDGPGQASVRGHCNEKFLGLLLLNIDLNNSIVVNTFLQMTLSPNN